MFRRVGFDMIFGSRSLVFGLDFFRLIYGNSSIDYIDLIYPITIPVKCKYQNDTKQPIIITQYFKP